MKKFTKTLFVVVAAAMVTSCSPPRIEVAVEKLGGRLLEETYVQLGTIYFEMDKLELAAAMAERLQREFPNSGFVDDALLRLADVARKQGNLNRAIRDDLERVSTPETGRSWKILNLVCVHVALRSRTSLPNHKREMVIELTLIFAF